MNNSPEAKALSNHLIRRELWPCLDADDLLNCRLVCRVWEREATTALVTLPQFVRDFGILFSYSPKNKAYVRGMDSEQEEPGNGNRNQNPRLLADFRQLLSRISSFRRIFPVTNYSVYYRDLADPDIFELLCDPQITIRSLTLMFQEGVGGWPKLETFWKILEARRDTLEHLQMFAPPWAWRNHAFGYMPLPDPDFLMPKLRTFNLRILYDQGFSPDVLRVILRAAPQLKELDGLPHIFPRPLLQAVVEEGRVDLIKTWFFHLMDETQNCLPVFKVDQPMLTTFGLYDELYLDFCQKPPRQVQILMQILNKSSTSLKYIDNFLPLILCPDINLPVMEKVEQLTQETFKLFRLEPQGVQSPRVTEPMGQIKQIFPGVEFLKIGKDWLNTRDFDFDLSLLEGYGLANMTSISHLDINLSKYGEKSGHGPGPCPLRMVQIGGRIGPNVTWLDIRTGVVPRLFPKVLQEIWTTFPRLTWLRFYFKDDEDVRRFEWGSKSPGWLEDENWLSQVDVAIVGFDAERCKILREIAGQVSTNDLHPESCQLSKAPLPSILDCKNLKYFSVEFVGEKEVKIWKLFSQVSYVYGFDLMPNLRLNLSHSRPSSSLGASFLL